MLKKSMLCGLTLLALAPSALSSALEDIKINGFATAGVVATDSSEAFYEDANNDFSFSPDSLMGLQFNIPVNEKLSFITQFTSKAKDDYKVEAEWAFAEFKVTPYFKVRAGRLRLPVYMISESLEVGYSYPWVRPPIEVYGQLDFDHIEGLETRFSLPLGNANLGLQAFVGSNNSTQLVLEEEGKLRTRNLRGFSMKFEYDWLQFRVGYAAGEFNLSNLPTISQSLATAKQLGFDDISNELRITDLKGEFFAAGFKLNPGNLLIMAEYAERKAGGVAFNMNGWYASIAYTFAERWTPYISIAHIESDEDVDDIRAQLVTLETTGNFVGTANPSLPNNLGTRLSTGLSNSINNLVKDQDSITVGLRIDVIDNTALKLEWQQMNPKGETDAFGLTDPAGGHKVELYSIALDYIF